MSTYTNLKVKISHCMINQTIWALHQGKIQISLGIHSNSSDRSDVQADLMYAGQSSNSWICETATEMIILIPLIDVNNQLVKGDNSCAY